MPELASVFIDGDACEFSNCGRLYYDNDDDDREEEDEDDESDYDNDSDDDDDDDDKKEEEYDDDDYAFVMKSEKRGENERIDLPKLTSFHVEDGYTLSRAHSFLFSGFAATLS